LRERIYYRNCCGRRVRSKKGLTIVETCTKLKKIKEGIIP